MTELTIATGNPHKVDEIRSIFATLGLDRIRLLGLSDAAGSPFPEPDETGASFEANATIKALAYARHVRGLCLADDSGIEIDALGGRPGVISSHYCTDGREAGMSRAERDAANNARVLRELADVPAALRSARFVCVMVLAEPGRTLATARGAFEGRIGREQDGVPRGTHGFGYDPIFLVAPDFHVSSAELSLELKNRLSHRGAAATRMAEWIRESIRDRRS